MKYTLKNNGSIKSKRVLPREILFGLSGYAGDLFYESNDEVMSISCHSLDDSLHPAHLSLLKRLCSIANHFKAITKFIANNRTCPDAYKRSLSSGLMSLIISYQNDLKLFDRLIDENANLSLTKFNIFIKYEQMFIILNQIIKMSQENETIVPAMDLLSEMSLHGNQSVRQACLGIESHFGTSLSFDIWSWMIFGYLRPYNSNFFIIKDDNEMKIDMSLLPSCIDAYIASRIYSTGQTVLLAQKRNVSVFAGKELQLFSNFNHIKFGSANKFEFDSFINCVAQIASEYSWKYIINEVHLVEHLEVIRDFYLTGKEEFWFSLIEQFSMLRLNGQTYNQKEIQKTFNHSLRQVVNIESYEVLAHSFQVSYDGLLTLEYALPEALHCVISVDSFEKYNLILNFMLKLYTARIKLQNVWINSMKDKSSKTVSSQAHRERWGLLHKLRCFIESFYYFFKVDVLGRLFQDLIQSIRSTKDVEAIQKEHQKFVADLLVQSFLKTTPIKKCILELFTFCNQISNSHALSQEFAREQLKTYQQTTSNLFHLLANIECRNINPLVSHLIIQIEKCITL